MKAKRYKAKQVGNDLETEVAKLLDEASIPYLQESTVSSGRKRVKGSVDFVLKNPIAYIECKAYTKSISYKYDSEIHDIHWSQLLILHKKHIEGYVSGLILKENTDKRLYFIRIEEFMKNWLVSSKKSLNLADVQRIGSEIGNIRELVDRTGDSVDKE